MKKIVISTSILAICIVAFMFGSKQVKAATYRIAHDTMVSASGQSYDYYNINKKLTQMEKEGGGTLIFESGHYYITNTLFISDNMTIKFEKNVYLEKQGTKGASSTMFQLIAKSLYTSAEIVGKHNGMKNIKFVGDGTTVIDMKNINIGKTAEIAVVMANNLNVSFTGITFKNVKQGHLIEMDGCKNVTFKNCKFQGMADNKYHNKEAINLDTNDWKTGGFSQPWSTKDKTPNENITIQNCEFSNLVRAVGTHRYSYKKYHKKIKFLNNTVTNVKTPLGMLNWKNSTISGNTFSNCKANKRYNYSFFMGGVRNVNFTNNVFSNVKAKEVLKYYAKYQTSHKEYKATKSKLSKKNIKALKNNRAIAGTKRKFKLGKKKYKWKK